MIFMKVQQNLISERKDAVFNSWQNETNMNKTQSSILFNWLNVKVIQ